MRFLLWITLVPKILKTGNIDWVTVTLVFSNTNFSKTGGHMKNGMVFLFWQPKQELGMPTVELHVTILRREGIMAHLMDKFIYVENEEARIRALGILQSQQVEGCSVYRRLDQYLTAQPA